ncbi:hypothetical protein [Mycolicibacterium nivoides]|uniref:Uncharacterized protein n=1 Tax=Mycolicibacterium nivoides TaxID=2487344 RepID=A0ABW9LI19_9MYCO
MIAGILRGLADLIDAVHQARTQQRAGFSDSEAGDYLDLAESSDFCCPVTAINERKAERPDRSAGTDRRE